MATATAPILLIVGLLAGAAGGWLLASARARAQAAEAARAAESATTMLRTDAAALRAERAALTERLDALTAQYDEVCERLRQAESQAAAAAAELRAERAAIEAREELLTRRDAELKEAFQALSAEALARNNEAFVALAEGRIREATTALTVQAKNDEEARKQAISALLEPVASTLERMEGRLRTVEKERESAYASLREQVLAMHRTSEQLQTETRQLVNALRAPQVRGRWGELQLERIVQLAGMVEHCDFSTQVTRSDRDGGTVRPDMVVHLPGGKQIVVDAKVPFGAYLEAVESTDPQIHAERLAAHARQLRQHVDTLSAKSYWEAFDPSPEFVVLFVPGDPFLEAALRADPTLLEHAFAHQVVIATPTTLIALLRTVAYGWRQEALAQNAAQVHQLGKELHSRLATMGNHIAKLGRTLESAVTAYNQTVSSLEARVLVTARKLTDLKVVDSELATPSQVERVPRTIGAPELVASASESLVALPDTTPSDRDSEPGSRATVNE